MREREVKLAVDGDFEVPDLEQTLSESGAMIQPAAEKTIVDVYYDTADFRLLGWGCTLRHRKRQGWTVKIPVVGRGKVSSRGDALERHEVQLGGRAGTPPPEARRLVASFSRAEPLTAVATFTTQRTMRPVQDADGQLLAEIADDRVSAEAADGTITTFRQVEVELAEDADPSILGPIVEAFSAAGARPDTDGIKLAIALGRPPLQPDVQVPKLSKRPSAREVIHRAIARPVAQLLLQLPIARLGEDPEGIHQARVATRRLRSDLRTFTPMLDADWIADLTPRLRELRAALGEVRDVDVLDELLRSTIDAHPEIDAAVGEVLDRLEERRVLAVASLEEHLDRDETVQLLDDLVVAAADPPTVPEADGPAEDLLPRMVRKRWRRLERAVKKMGKRPSPEDRHKVRLLAKQARYATDSVKPAFGRRTRRFAKALANLQDTMGDLNDASIAEEWLTQGAAELSPSGAFAAGRLAQSFRNLSVADDDWRAGWSEVKRQKPRWLDR